MLEKLMYLKSLLISGWKQYYLGLTVCFYTNFSTVHVSGNLTENISQALDEACSGYGILIDLQKVFDTVVHEILLAFEIRQSFRASKLQSIMVFVLF